jgi:hypothetical protein
MTLALAPEMAATTAKKSLTPSWKMKMVRPHLLVRKGSRAAAQVAPAERRQSQKTTERLCI